MEPPHDSVREIRLLGRAASPNVIPLWESFKDGSALVLVFPFMPYTLDMILRQGYLAEAHGRTYLLHIFRALAHLHALKIIHRDIKPANILMKTPSGPAYLADFGIAWSGDDPASEPADKKITDVGTTSYRPPEVLFGKTDYDETLDLWAAGCLAAQVVTSNAEPLFDSGDVGSDLTLIQSIFKALGTPKNEVQQNPFYL
jgi:serine/threonine protein kinase